MVSLSSEYGFLQPLNNYFCKHSMKSLLSIVGLNFLKNDRRGDQYFFCKNGEELILIEGTFYRRGEHYLALMIHEFCNRNALNSTCISFAHFDD